MNRTSQDHPETDPDLRRPDPDSLPRLRRCKLCGSLYPLDAQHFAEDSRRYPWSMSRFDTRCLPCMRSYSRAWSAKRKDARNAQDRARRAAAKASCKPGQPATMTEAQWLACMHPEAARGIVATRQARADAKVRRALGKRRLLRAMGSRPSWVTLKIQRDMAAAKTKRTRVLDAQAKAWVALSPQKALEAVRALHRSQQGA